LRKPTCGAMRPIVLLYSLFHSTLPFHKYVPILFGLWSVHFFPLSVSGNFTAEEVLFLLFIRPDALSFPLILYLSCSLDPEVGFPPVHCPECFDTVAPPASSLANIRGPPLASIVPQSVIFLPLDPSDPRFRSDATCRFFPPRSFPINAR